MSDDDAKELKELRAENSKLNRLVANVLLRKCCCEELLREHSEINC